MRGWGWGGFRLLVPSGDLLTQQRVSFVPQFFQMIRVAGCMTVN